MTTAADYASRRVDVLAFAGARRTGEVLLEQALAAAGKGGEITAGIQKLAQWFLLELLTERGSLTYAPDQGTYFMQEARQGYLRTASDVQGAFARAVYAITLALQDDETEDDPDDERFHSAELLAITVSGTGASLTVRLLSKAGVYRDILLPLPIVV